MSNINLNIEYCFTCLKVCSAEDKFLSLSFPSSQQITYRRKLQICVPEMGPEFDVDSYICKPCSVALEQAYSFRCLCLKTESKLSSVRDLQKNNLWDVKSIKTEFVQVLSRENHSEILPMLDKSVDSAPALERRERDQIVHELESLLSESFCTTSICKRSASPIVDLPTTRKKPLTEDKLNPKQSLTDGELNPRKSLTDDELNPKRSLRGNKLNPRKSLTDGELNSKKSLTDDELIELACTTNPELENVSLQSLKCQVTLEKLVITKLPVIVPSSAPNKTTNNKTDNNKVPFTCNKCGKVIIKKDHYYSHMLKHSNIRAYRCKFCPASYFYSDSLRYHNQRHHPNSSSKVNSLTEAFKKNNGLEAKSDSAKRLSNTLSNNRTDQQFPCLFCSETFSIHRMLNRHLIDVHTTTVPKPVKKKKKKKKVLPVIVKVEPTDDEPLDKTIDNLMNDVKSQIGFKSNGQSKKNKRRYFCAICNMNFSTRDHANIHTGARPYACNGCFKTFSAYQGLHKHRKIHEREAQSKPSCKLCKQTFSSSNDFIAHTCQTSSGESVYRCQICKNAYLGKTALVDHMRVHLEDNNSTI